MPIIYIDGLTDGFLVLRHEHDKRDLELGHAESVVQHLNVLWEKGVKLYTIIEEDLWEI